MGPFIQPENRQHHLPAFEKRMEEGIGFFPCRDFLLLHSRAKLYGRDIWTDLCRSGIIALLHTLTKSLFLFYGKGLLFYCHPLPDSGKCIFRDKRYSNYIERYFKIPEWILGISDKKFPGKGRLNHISGNQSGSQGRLSHISGNQSGSPGRLNHISGNESGSPGRLNHFSGKQSGSPGRLNHFSGNQSGSPGRLSHISGNESGSPGRGNHFSGKQSGSPGRGNHFSGKQSGSPGRRIRIFGSKSRKRRSPPEMKESNLLRIKSVPASIAGYLFPLHYLSYFLTLKLSKVELRDYLTVCRCTRCNDAPGQHIVIMLNLFQHPLPKSGKQGGCVPSPDNGTCNDALPSSLRNEIRATKPTPDKRAISRLNFRQLLYKNNVV